MPYLNILWDVYRPYIAMFQTSISCEPRSEFNLILICPQCGEVWARRIVKGPRDTWQPAMRECAEHGGGSLFDRREWEYPHPDAVTLYPDEMLRREILVWKEPSHLLPMASQRGSSSMSAQGS